MAEIDGRDRSGRTAMLLAVVAVIVAAVCVVAAARWLVGPDGPGHGALGALDDTVQALPSPEVSDDGLVPVRIALPTIDIETQVEAQRSVTEYSPALGYDLTAFGLPSQKSSAAWWSDGPRPGAGGMSVIVGHAGAPADPGVFDGIGGMRRGDKIVLRSETNEVVTYLVNDVITGLRARDPAELQKQLVADPVAKAVALVTYGRDDAVQEFGRIADVVVFGHLRSN